MSEFNGLGLKCGCALLVFIMSTGNEPLVLIESTNGILDVLLQYGLYLGAVFQLICIFAAVLIPTSADGQEEETDVTESEETPATSREGDATAMHRHRRHEKKKRR